MKILIDTLKRRMEELRAVIAGANRWTKLPDIMAKQHEANQAELAAVGFVLEQEHHLLELGEAIEEQSSIGIAVVLCNLALAPATDGPQATLNDLVHKTLVNSGLLPRLQRFMRDERRRAKIRFGNVEQINNLLDNLIRVQPTVAWIPASTTVPTATIDTGTPAVGRRAA